MILTSNSLRDPQRDIADIYLLSITIPGSAQAAGNAAASVLSRPDGGDPGDGDYYGGTGRDRYRERDEHYGGHGRAERSANSDYENERGDENHDDRPRRVYVRLDGALATIDDETMVTLSTTLAAAGKGVGNVRVAELAMTEEEVMGALRAVLAAVEEGAGYVLSAPLATADVGMMGVLSIALNTTTNEEVMGALSGEEEEIDILQFPHRREG